MVELRTLTEDDIEAHNRGEDKETIRWLSGRAGTKSSTRSHFAMLAENAKRSTGKRGFGIWHEGQLAGYIDFDPDADDLPKAGDVSISYTVHPWARRQGIATAAVHLVCAHLSAEGLGSRAIIRVEPGNAASVRVAECSGFQLLAPNTPTIGRHMPTTPVAYTIYGFDLARNRISQRDGL